MANSADTIVGALWHRAALHETTPVLRFLSSGDITGPTTEWDFATLHRHARRIAADLAARGLTGKPVLLIHPPGLDFIAAFVGCLYANVIAVPVYPPSPADLPASIARILMIASDCGTRTALTTPDFRTLAAAAAGQVPQLAELTWVTFDTSSASDDLGRESPPRIAAHSVAFLQYTSGSTGAPKGVVVRHDNLWFNLRAGAHAFPGSRMVSWLPAYHDMGLIGGIFLPLAFGRSLTFFPPHEFLRRPARWMRVVSQFGADLITGPNFGYMLAANKTEDADLEGLDLSGLRHAVVGAEPVAPQMLRAFTQRFAPCGFDPRAFAPAFGLAEATLMVSTRAVACIPKVARFATATLTRGVAEPTAEAGIELVGCGTSIPGQRLLIVDPETLLPLPERCVGEILVSGPSVATEYFGRPDSRAQVFQCVVPGERDTFLRTGDLGFLLEGELYVSGRLKDLIIVRGKNHAAPDLEATIERELSPALRPGRVVATALATSAGEALLVLAEARDHTPREACPELMRRIAGAVAAHHGVEVHTVALLEKGGLPRTSSGKLQRRAAREAFLAGTLAVWARATFAPDSPPDPAADTALYGTLAEIRDRLDKRGTGYRFDLERDIQWSELGERPGLYLPRKILIELGVDVPALEANPEAFALYQWAAALSTCRTFELLEWGIIQFCRRERSALGATQSIDNLCAEEEKHIQAFRRYALYLERQRPELVAPFEAAFRESFAFLRALFDPGSGAPFHLQIWLDTLLFEPYSLHLAQALATTPEPIEPVWRRLHELHAREEGHHVVTAGQYISALLQNLPTGELERVTQQFLAQVNRGFAHILGCAAPNRLVAERWPALGLGGMSRPAIPPSFLHVLGTAKHFASLRRAVPALAVQPPLGARAPRPDLVLLLSSERSGSTLLRVMLSGHPALFAPPELNLLTFATLAARARDLPAAQQDGLIQALIELYGESRAAAEERLARAGRDSGSTLAIYEELVRALAGRTLIDKSPLYSRDLQALRRAEAHFGARVRYVYLTRHPYAAIDSYARVGLQRLVVDPALLGRDARELGELGWTLSHRTIQTFLAEIDPGRSWRIRFEDLMADPRGEMMQLLEFLEVPWDEAVLSPYQHGRMVSGTGPTALVGDPNFAARSRIETALGEAWKGIALPKPLGAEACRLAAALGYALPSVEDAAAESGRAATAPPGRSEEAASPAKPAERSVLAEVREVTVRIIAQAAQRAATELRDDTTIASLGLSSLELIRLTDRLERELGRALDAMTLYEHPTVGALVQQLAAAAPAAPSLSRAPGAFGAEVELGAEVHLDDALRVTDRTAVAATGAVLLTGGTGFLGAYLLQRLLQESDVVVHCLVRAPGPDAALARIRENLTRYGIWDPAYAARIVAESGDLAHPRLGLLARRFDELAERIGAIYHNGALLRFDQPYQALRAANVEGTRDIIRLAVQGRVKPLHYISTVAVFDAFKHKGAQVDEGTALDSWEGLRLGYAQTKWVAEKLVGLAAERGVPVTIYRPAGIAGDSATGAWNTGDLVCRLLKGCVLVGAVPRLAFDVDMAPIDYVSRAVVWLSRQPGAAGAIHHLNHPQPLSWSRLCAWMRFRGYALQEVTYKDWLHMVRADARSEGHPLAPLLPFLSLRLPPDGQTLFEARQARPRVTCAATAARLAAGGLRCPPLGHELLATFFDFMTRDGFLPSIAAP